LDILKLIRSHLLYLKSYSSARDEYEGEKGVFLDANENAIGSVNEKLFNRYPDPHHLELKQKLSKVKNISLERIFIGNGSDEPIDLLIRIFCRPGIDNVIVCPPTYGMYAVSAAINDIEVREAQLNDDFQLNTSLIDDLTDNNTKILFLCSPNNPTGNLLREHDIENLLSNFPGIIVIDEAYIDFANNKSWINRLHEYPNLVILQTFSKAWGLANLRIGMCFASSLIIFYLEKIKPPYNVNGFSQKAAIEALENENIKNKYVQMLNDERERLKTELAKFTFIKHVFHSDVNFLLIRTDDAKKLYDYLIEHGIIVRNRSNLPLCQNTLRITIGTFNENNQLLSVLKKFES
jgi:histidinol-phosphate aminotransferase